MVSFKPARSGSAHIALPAGLVLCGLSALLGAAYKNVFYPALLQAIGFVLLGAAVLAINRYSLPTFIYTVDEETPELLCVHRIVGKKKQTPITADLRLAVSVRMLTAEQHSKPSGARRVNLCLNVFPGKRMAILFRDKGRPTELVLETDDDFFHEIEKRVNAGR